MAGIPFWSLLAIAFSCVAYFELRERSLQKKKQGVYRGAWRGRAADGASSLREQLDDMDTFEGQSVGREDFQNAHFESVEEQRARQFCPTAERVSNTATLTQKAKKTNALFQRAWDMFQRNELVEKGTKLENWERDDHGIDILSEVQRLVHIREQADINSDDSDSDAAVSYDSDDTDDDDAKAPTIKALENETMEQVYNESGYFFRSTVVRLTNATDTTLQIKSRFLATGRWLIHRDPPTTIPPWTEVAFCSTGTSAWFGKLCKLQSIAKRVPSAGCRSSQPPPSLQARPRARWSTPTTMWLRLTVTGSLGCTGPTRRFRASAAVSATCMPGRSTRASLCGSSRPTTVGYAAG